MNILDATILAFLLINLIMGLYNGFIVSVLNIIAYFGSWLLSFIFYPILSKALIAKTSLLETIMYFTDASSKITDFTQRKLAVGQLGEGKLASIVEGANLPMPFDRAILASATDNTAQSVETLAEYFDYTVAKVLISIISFFIVFFIVRIIFAAIIGAAKAVRDVPALKHLDSLAGAGLGIVRGFLLLYILFSILPLLLTLAPIDFISDMIDASKFASFFYKTNILIRFIR